MLLNDSIIDSHYLNLTNYFKLMVLDVQTLVMQNSLVNSKGLLYIARKRIVLFSDIFMRLRTDYLRVLFTFRPHLQKWHQQRTLIPR